MPSVRSALVFIGVALVALPRPGAQSKAAPLDRDAERWVDRTLKQMTLDEKIGQLLVTSFNATFTSADSEAYAKLRHLVRKLKVGGIHVFGATETMPPLLLNSTYGSGGTVSRKGDPYAAAALL